MFEIRNGRLLIGGFYHGHKHTPKGDPHRYMTVHKNAEGVMVYQEYEKIEIGLSDKVHTVYAHGLSENEIIRYCRELL